jgi:hypothetical protein
MSMPSPDYYQQTLAYLQVWRELLERSAAATAGLAPNSPFMAFMPPPMPMPGMAPMPGMPQMPPAAPLVPPAPADYAQQLFGYLQAWRQYLEQMAGATSGPSRSPTANYEGSQFLPAHPPVQHIPPPDSSGSKRLDRTDKSTNASEASTVAPPNEGGSANTYGSRFASGSEKRPPDEVLVVPTTEGGTFVPSNYGNRSNYGNALRSPGGPVAESRGDGQDAPQVLRPPIYDWGNQWLPTTLRRTGAASPPTSPAPRAQRSPAAAPAARTVGSPFLGAMGRVTPDASPPAQPKSLFKNLGQTPSP